MIYLDHNATTPIAPEVVDAMRPHLVRHFGNPSSAHAHGATAAAAVARARAEIAGLLGGEDDAFVFTASGSEADNLAIKGVALAHLGDRDHIITSAVEHPAVLATCRYLQRRFGSRLTIVPVDSCGVVDPDDVRRAIEPRTVLVSVMHANNEVGTVQPIAEIAAVAHERGVLVHTDAAQSVGGAAAALARGRLRAGAHVRIRALRDRLHAALRSAVPELALNGHPRDRLPNTLNVSFPGLDGEELLARTPSIAAATGSACHSGRSEPSAVLTAMGLDDDRALGAVRLSLGYDTTEADVDAAAAALAAAALRYAGTGRLPAA